jgi:hypothetical protein
VDFDRAGRAMERLYRQNPFLLNGVYLRRIEALRIFH